MSIEETSRQAGVQLAKELRREARAPGNLPPFAGLTNQVIAKLEEEFEPVGRSAGRAAQEGRGDQAYWLDHCEATGTLMRLIAGRWGGDHELYYRVGRVHDLDYLRFPHDVAKSKGGDQLTHPVPLALAMRKKGVHSAVTLAVLEHAPYLGLRDEPSSRLSATLSAAEDLTTIAALEPPFDDTAKLSAEAQELLRTVRIHQRIYRDGKVRVEFNPERFVNKPLALVVQRGTFPLDV